MEVARGKIQVIDPTENSLFFVARPMTNEKIIFNAGGGIVVDSDPIDEYVESLHKANHLVRLFQ